MLLPCFETAAARPPQHEVWALIVRRLIRLGAGLAKFLAGTALAILVFLVGAFFQVRGALPPYSGHVEAAGLKAPVEILRDKNAVPHIIAGSIEDAAFGLGYVHAQDRSGRWS